MRSILITYSKYLQVSKEMIYSCFILSLLVITSCRDFTDETNSYTTGDGEEIEVILSASIPAVNTLTKSMSTTDENQIQDIDILVFEVDGENEKYAYRTHNINELESSENDDILYIRASFKISEDKEKYRIVLLANLRNELDAMLGNSDEEGYVGMDKEEMLQEIIVEQQGRWPANNDLGYRALPMWGEASQATIINKHTTPSSFGGDISMLRSVARIQVSVNILTEDGLISDGTDFFDLAEIKVYNAREKGYAVPFPKNMENGKVKKPSILEDSGIISPKDMTYILKEIYSNHKNKLTNDIYVNEVVNKGTENSEAFFLIIKGYYTEPGEVTNTSIPTYYRVDFYETGIDSENPSEARGDILRNYNYHINISGINGPGYPDEEDAIKSIAKNLSYSITDWSEGEMKHVVFYGPYYLAVSESTIEMPKNAGSESFLVKTNYPGGWTASVSQDADWISGIPPMSSTELEKSERLTFNVTENDTEDVRKGVIAISCGSHLTLDVYINQLIEDAANIIVYVYDNDINDYIELTEAILFPSGYHTGSINSRKFKVNWTPGAKDLNVYYDSDYAWGDETDVMWKYSGYDGEVFVNLVPQAVSSLPSIVMFPETETEISVWVGDERNSERKAKLRQRHYDVYTSPADRYEMDGERHSFKIFSNTEWTVNVIQGEELISLLQTEGSITSTNGDAFYFNVVNKAGISAVEEVILEFTFKDFDQYITKEVILELYSEGEDITGEIREVGDANCYILHPNGAAVRIPVAQANRGAGDKISTGEELDIEFIWTDHPNGLDKTGNGDAPVIKLEMDYSEGYGPLAYLIAYPGSVEGNVVVGVKSKSTGNLYWSWHLWVTDFDPDHDEEDRYQFNYYQFMDRNLGALSENRGTQANMGLYYQWGRKDPFPSAREFESSCTQFVVVYKEDGTPWDPNGKLDVIARTSSNNDGLRTSIRNPRSFINPTDNTFWASSEYSYIKTSEYFWNEGTNLSDATKGVYDPCPDGWKTVPGSFNNNSSEWYLLFRDTQYHSEFKSSNVYNKAYVDLGLWPHAGYITSTGSLTGVVTQGRYWTGHRSPWALGEAVNTVFQSSGSGNHPAESRQVSFGQSVRCMRRMDNKFSLGQ